VAQVRADRLARVSGSAPRRRVAVSPSGAGLVESIP
jgi:hypothetical protein